MTTATPARGAAAKEAAAASRKSRNGCGGDIDKRRYWPTQDLPSGKCAMCVRGMGPHREPA